MSEEEQRKTLDQIVDRIIELRALREQIDPHDWQFQTGRTILTLLTVLFHADDITSCEIMSKLVGEIWIHHEGNDAASEKRFNEATHRMFEAAREDQGIRSAGVDKH